MQWLKKYIGLQFKDHHRGPKYFDCYGLYWYVRKNEFNDLNLPSYDDKYASCGEGHIKELMINEALSWKEIKYGFEKVGDILRIRIPNLNPPPSYFWHVGMVLDNGNMLHIMKGIDSCVENYRNKYWRNKIFSIHRPSF